MRIVALIVSLVILNFYIVHGLQHAVCKLQGQNVTGRIDLYGLCNGDTHVIISAAGNNLINGNSYALQIEEYAKQNVPFNPFNKPHGCPENITSHAVGDLGNLVVTADNSVQMSFVVPQNASLFLVGPYSVVGRDVRLYSVADDCVSFPQNFPNAVVLAECTLGIASEITFSEAFVDNNNITAAYCAFNNSGADAVIYFQKLNKTFEFTASANGLSSTTTYTFSVQTYGDLFAGFGPQSSLAISVKQQPDLTGLLTLTTSISLTNLSEIIGRGLLMTDQNNNTVGQCVIGVTNSSYVFNSVVSSKTSDTNKPSSSHPAAAPTSSNTVVWVAVGVSAAVAATAIFGTIFYIKIKNSNGRNLYI